MPPPPSPAAGPRPDPPNPAALLAAMGAVRERGNRHAADLSAAATRSADWTNYVKAAPLACAAVAAAAGYLVIPSRPRAPKVVRVKGGGKSGAAAPAAVVEKPVSGRGPWMGALSVLGNVALRAGTAYLSQQAGKAFGESAAGGTTPPEPGPSAGTPGPARADRPFRGPR